MLMAWATCRQPRPVLPFIPDPRPIPASTCLRLPPSYSVLPRGTGEDTTLTTSMLKLTACRGCLYDTPTPPIPTRASYPPLPPAAQVWEGDTTKVPWCHDQLLLSCESCLAKRIKPSSSTPLLSAFEITSHCTLSTLLLPTRKGHEADITMKAIILAGVFAQALAIVAAAIGKSPIP